MYILPHTWNVVSSKKTEAPKTAIQIFGRDEKMRTVYVKVPMCYTYVIRFARMKSLQESIKLLQEDENVMGAEESEMDDMVLVLHYRVLIDPSAYPKKWKDVQVNPAGSLSSMFKRISIRPYDWLYIEKPAYMRPQFRRTTCQLEVYTTEDRIRNLTKEEVSDFKIETPEVRSSILFWDIETSSADNTTSNPSSDPIFAITVVRVSPERKVFGAILHTKSADEQKIRDVISSQKGRISKNPVEIFAFESETDMLLKFFTYTRDVDYHVTYNGDSFDIPYVIKRMKVLGIAPPVMGKIRGVSGFVDMLSMTPVGPRVVSSFVMPGTYSVDLLPYFRRFYPDMENHKLETVARRFLKEGKADMSYKLMWLIERKNDAKRMVDVLWYAYKDVYLLYRLWMIQQIEVDMLRTCNLSQLDIYSIIRTSNKSLMYSLYYNVDPGSIFMNLKERTFNRSMMTRPGLYRNIYRFSYARLISRYLVKNLKEKGYPTYLFESISNFPTNIVHRVFRGMMVSKEDMRIYENLMSSLYALEGFSFIDENNIWFKDKEGKQLLDYLGRADIVLRLAPKSYLVYANGVVERYGRGKNVKPKFPYMLKVQERYLEVVAKIPEGEVGFIDHESLYRDITRVNVAEMIMTVGIRHPMYYKKQDTDSYLIAEMVDEEGHIQLGYEPVQIRYMYVTIEDEESVGITVLYDQSQIGEQIPHYKHIIEIIEKTLNRYDSVWLPKSQNFHISAKMKKEIETISATMKMLEKCHGNCDKDGDDSDVDKDGDDSYSGDEGDDSDIDIDYKGKEEDEGEDGDIDDSTIELYNIMDIIGHIGEESVLENIDDTGDADTGDADTGDVEDIDEKIENMNSYYDLLTGKFEDDFDLIQPMGVGQMYTYTGPE